MRIMNYAKGEGREKDWLIEESTFDERYLGKCEAIFTQGNGYLGVRNALEEQYLNETRGMFIAGTFNKASAAEVTELPNIADVLNMELKINGERFSMNAGIVEDYSRILNLYTGETCRELVWTSPAGDRLKLSFHRFVSYDNIHVIGNYVELTPLSGGINVEAVSGINAQVTNSGAQHLNEVTKRVYEEKYLQFHLITSESKVEMAVGTVHRLLCGGREFEPDKMWISDDRRKLFCGYKLIVKKGQRVRIEKLSVVHTSRDLEYTEQHESEKEYTDPERRIQREYVCRAGLVLLQDIEAKGYDSLFAASREVWENIWRDKDILIKGGDGCDQVAIRFALYHLQIMVRRGDNRVGIGAKALSGEGYKGHSFWDTESFILPYFQMAEPETARTLLEYRYKGLYGARKKAKEYNFEGAMFPWEAAWVRDGEVTPYVIGINVHTGEEMICLTGVIELHITADIIYALWAYYTATGDEDFMEKYGYEMIVETGRFWNSRLEWIESSGRYEIRDVIGPDEYKEHVDNNAYTNYLAKFNLELAVQIIGTLEGRKPEIYKRLSALADLEELKRDMSSKLAKLYLPQPDEKTGIIPQYDGYFQLQEINLKKYKSASVVGTVFQDYSLEELQHYQAGKQADVVELLYLMEDLADTEIRRRNYLYYEARTLHDSSLSKAIHSVMACDLGMMEEAYTMFREAAFTDLGPEMTSSNAGIHSANMGGVWQDVVMGFGGVRIRNGRLRLQPHLPKEWEQLTYSIYWRGNKLVVIAGQDCVEIMNHGASFEATVFGNEVVVESGKNVFR